MENHAIQVFCPKETCRGAVRIGPDGVARCVLCREPLGVWASRPTWAPRPADPRDWDIQTVSLVHWPRRLAWAAALLLSLSLGLWLLLQDGTDAAEPSPPTATADLTTETFLDAVRTGHLPPGLDLPAIYQDPGLIGRLKQSAFASPSPLVKQWLQLSSRQKVEVLGVVIDTPDIAWLFAFLGELAYSGIALEPEPAIALQIASGVHASGSQYAPAAIFLLDHIEQVCAHDVVREYAGTQAANLRARVGALGH